MRRAWVPVYRGTMPRLELQCTHMSGPTSSRPSASRGACALVAIMSMLVVLAWTAARIHYAFGGNWTAAFCTGMTARVPPDLDAGTYRFEGAGYDGQFYRYWRTTQFSKEVTSAMSMRRNCVSPASGSAGGLGVRLRAAELDRQGVHCRGDALRGVGRILVRPVDGAPRSLSAWGLLFVVVPATLASFDRMLVDGPLTALFAGFLLYCEEERWGGVWVLAMLAALTRETGLLLGAALVTDRLWHRDWRRAAWLPRVASRRSPGTGI